MPGRVVPAAARTPRPAPGARRLAALPLGRHGRRRAGGADGAHRRRAGRRVGAVAAPTLRGGDPRRLDLGSRHPGRQGFAGRHLRCCRAAPRGRLRAQPRRVALLRGSRGGLRAGRTGRRRGAAVTRRDAVVRPRRGRGHRAPGVPRGRAAARGRGGLREGHHDDRAAGRGARRALLDTGARRTDREDRAGRRTTGEAAVRRVAAGADAGAVHPDRAARTAARCGPCSPTPVASSRCSSARCWRPVRSPPPWCVRRWPSRRSPAPPRTT